MVQRKTNTIFTDVLIQDKGLDFSGNRKEAHH